MADPLNPALKRTSIGDGDAVPTATLLAGEGLQETMILAGKIGMNGVPRPVSLPFGCRSQIAPTVRTAPLHRNVLLAVWSVQARMMLYPLERFWAMRPVMRRRARDGWHRLLCLPHAKGIAWAASATNKHYDV